MLRLSSSSRVVTAIYIVIAALGALGSVFLPPYINAYIAARPPTRLFNLVDAVVNIALAIFSWPYWFYALGGGVILFIGLMWDWFARKFDGSRARDRQELGAQMLSHVSTLKTVKFNERTVWKWPDTINYLRPEFLSTYFSAISFGIWAPGERVYKDNRGEEFLINYFSYVGELLNDGHFAKAKEAALHARSDWNERNSRQRV